MSVSQATIPSKGSENIDHSPSDLEINSTNNGSNNRKGNSVSGSPCVSPEVYLGESREILFRDSGDWSSCLSSSGIAIDDSAGDRSSPSLRGKSESLSARAISSTKSHSPMEQFSPKLSSSARPRTSPPLLKPLSLRPTVQRSCATTVRQQAGACQRDLCCPPPAKSRQAATLSQNCACSVCNNNNPAAEVQNPTQKEVVNFPPSREAPPNRYPPMVSHRVCTIPFPSCSYGDESNVERNEIPDQDSNDGCEGRSDPCPIDWDLQSIPMELMIQQLANPKYREVTADLQVKVKGQIFKCHRFLLAHYSRYFYNILKQRQGKMFVEVGLRDVSPDAFSIIYEWMYTCQLCICPENLIEVLHTSQYLDVPEVVVLCMEYLNKLVECPDILLGLYCQAMASGKRCLGEHILRLLAVVFRHIVCNPCFVNLDVDAICFLLSCDNLNINSEKDAFNAALRWLCFDLENRKNNAVDILCTVRFGLMTDEELFECLHCEASQPIMCIPECRLLVLQGYLYHTSVAMGTIDQFPHLKITARRPLWQQLQGSEGVEDVAEPSDDTSDFFQPSTSCMPFKVNTTSYPKCSTDSAPSTSRQAAPSCPKPCICSPTCPKPCGSQWLSPKPFSIPIPNKAYCPSPCPTSIPKPRISSPAKNPVLCTKANPKSGFLSLSSCQCPKLCSCPQPCSCNKLCTCSQPCSCPRLCLCFKFCTCPKLCTCLKRCPCPKFCTCPKTCGCMEPCSCPKICPCPKVCTCSSKTPSSPMKSEPTFCERPSTSKKADWSSCCQTYSPCPPICKLPNNSCTPRPIPWWSGCPCNACTKLPSSAVPEQIYRTGTKTTTKRERERTLPCGPDRMYEQCLCEEVTSPTSKKRSKSPWRNRWWGWRRGTCDDGPPVPCSGGIDPDMQCKAILQAECISRKLDNDSPDIGSYSRAGGNDVPVCNRIQFPKRRPSSEGSQGANKPKFLQSRKYCSCSQEVHNVNHNSCSPEQMLIPKKIQPICVPNAKLDRIYLLGGLNPLESWSCESAGKLIYIYNPEKNKWKKFEELPAARHHAAATIVNGNIFLTGIVQSVHDQKQQKTAYNNFSIIRPNMDGGCCPAHANEGRKIEALPTAWCFSLRNMRWCTLKDMERARIHHSMAACGNCIYAIGGQDECGELLRSVECFSLESDSWKQMSPLQSPRMGMASSCYKGCIWVCGGMGLKDREKCPSVVKNVEYFNPTTNSWCQVNCLRFPRCFACLVDYNGVLHLIGGVTRVSSKKEGVISSVASMDVYDSCNDEWYFKAALQVPRHSAAVAVANEQLYIIGGITSLEASALDCVECYDDNKHGWIRGISHLPIPLSGMACVVAYDFNAYTV